MHPAHCSPAGKTLQSVALLLTVLRQGMNGARTARRAIVVCPTSLVSNWANEIKKWIGERLRPLPLAEASREQAIDAIGQFLSPAVPYDVLIISYETFRIHADKFHAKPVSGRGSTPLIYYPFYAPRDPRRVHPRT